MDKSKTDYSLYLVTDSTPAILGGKDIVQVVESALKGGVTCVQYREKHADTGDLIATAKKLHAVTQKYNVPLLINDRVDVALAVGCEGVHIGQDDIGKPLRFPRCVRNSGYNFVASGQILGTGGPRGPYLSREKLR